MQESTETPLGPAIETKKGETQYPYQEQKELWGKRKFDTLIVFGQGPVKPVILIEELTDKQREEWENFKKDPLHNKEPDFRVIEGTAYILSLEEIDKRTDLSSQEKQQLKDLKRKEWQNLGRFALNRWGRENALAAGLSLYLGITDQLILSGGRTIPSWYKEKLQQEFINNNPSISKEDLDQQFEKWLQENWPSEAQLMKNIIIRRFGKIYQKRYGKSIEEAIQIEDGSTNTLLNFANSINKDPSLISSEGKTGFLATDFHIRRCLFLAKLFSVIETSPKNLSTEAQRILNELDNVFSVEGPVVKSQKILGERATIRRKQKYQEIQQWLLNLEENPDLQHRVKGEKRWTRGLTDPQFLEYFACYFGEFNKPKTLKPLQNFLALLREPDWLENAQKVFKNVGLNLNEFLSEDLQTLIKQDPQKFNQLIENLKNIPRKAPPEE